MDIATVKKDLENQIGSINEDLKNIYLPLETVLILLGKRTAFQIALELIDSLQQEQPEVDLEEELNRYLRGEFKQTAGGNFNNYIQVARHFAEWGARHSINWGDVQLLDTFILELSREEKDGTDWGDSEKFYTEVLRRFHEFNDKKISEIVAEWGAEHARKEDK